MNNSPIPIPEEFKSRVGLWDYNWAALVNAGAGPGFFPYASYLKPFDPGISTYSPINAWWMSELCRLVYRRGKDEAGTRAPFPPRSRILADVGFQEIAFVNTGGIQFAIVTGAVRNRAEFSILVFRGTNRFYTWFSNCMAHPVSWPGGGRVHGGFYYEFQKIWDRVRQALTNLEGPVFYAGHSLGGAFAIMAASLKPPLSVYTFGSPRAGDSAFCRLLGSVPVFRVKNPWDRVPTVPFKNHFSEYSHAGESINLPLPNKTQRPLTRMPDSLAAHAPVNYSACLAREIFG
jgi:hypothetical protein